jgi:hypothetical protein
LILLGALLPQLLLIIGRLTPEVKDNERTESTSEEQEADRDEATRSEEPEDRTRSQDKTTPTRMDEASNRYPIPLAAGIALMGLALCGFLATRAIFPWRR